MSALWMLLGAALAQDCEGPEDCLEQGLEQAIVVQDAAAARPLLEKACVGGESQACFHVALLRLAGGEKLEVPLSEAGQSELKRRCAAEQGRACLQLGLLHDEGPMAWRDMSQASMYFRQACAAGQPEGCVHACEMGHAASCEPPEPPPPPKPAP
jgi:TPR repeat protein